MYLPGKQPATIQVRAIQKPGPAGGKGKPARGWVFPASSADWLACADLSTSLAWLFTMDEARGLGATTLAGRQDAPLLVHRRGPEGCKTPDRDGALPDRNRRTKPLAGPCCLTVRIREGCVARVPTTAGVIRKVDPCAECAPRIWPSRSHPLLELVSLPRRHQILP